MTMKAEIQAMRTERRERLTREFKQWLSDQFGAIGPGVELVNGRGERYTCREIKWDHNTPAILCDAHTKHGKLPCLLSKTKLARGNWYVG